MLFRSLPVYPLDGGQLMKVILESMIGHRALRVSALISVFIAIGISILAFMSQSMLLGIVFSMLGFEAWQLFKSSEMLTEQDHDQGYQERFDLSKKHYEQGEIDLAIENLKSLRKDLSRGSVYLMSSELLAHIYYEQGEKAACLEILKESEKVLGYEAL